MTTPKPNAVAVVEACLASSSERAWLDFVQLFQPLIASVIIRVVRRYAEFDRALADDLTQEVYVRLCKENCKALRQFEHRHEDSIFGFVKVVAASVAMDHFRARRAEKRVGEVGISTQDGNFEVAAPSADPHRALITDQIFAHLEQVTANPRDRSIFRLYYVQGYSAKDISEIPGVQLSAKGVESTILRLVQAIRREMNILRPRKRSGDEGLSPFPPVGDIR